MRVQTKFQPNKKTIKIVTVDDVVWGILKLKILQSFSKQDEFDVTEEQLELLKKEILKFGWQKLCDFLSYRERSVRESYLYLKKNHFEKTIIEKLILEAKNQNYLSDKRFAESLIVSLLNKKKSKKECLRKLREHKISEEDYINTLNYYYTSENNRNIIENHVRKLIEKYSNLPKYELKNKCLSFLYRKGFSYDESLTIIENCLKFM